MPRCERLRSSNPQAEADGDSTAQVRCVLREPEGAKRARNDVQTQTAHLPGPAQSTAAPSRVAATGADAEQHSSYPMEGVQVSEVASHRGQAEVSPGATTASCAKVCLCLGSLGLYISAADFMHVSALRDLL